MAIGFIGRILKHRKIRKTKKLRVFISLMSMLIVLLCLFGVPIFIAISSFNNWFKEDIPVYNKKLVLSRCNDWRNDAYFQSQVQRLPDNPAVIEIMLDRGWVYRSDPEVYNSYNHYPHLNEIKAEFPSNITYKSRIDFVGDCTTKTILFCNILSFKNMSFDIIYTNSFTNLRAHTFVTYPGRNDAVKVEKITSKSWIVADSNSYLYIEKNKTFISPLNFDDLKIVYERKQSKLSLKLFVFIFISVCLWLLFNRKLILAWVKRKIRSRNLDSHIHKILGWLRLGLFFIVKPIKRFIDWLYNKLEGGNLNAIRNNATRANRICSFGRKSRNPRE